MSSFKATALANGSSQTSTVPPTTVTATATATATSNVSQQDAQTLANNIAQSIANSAALNDANIISHTVKHITSTGIAGATGPTGSSGSGGSSSPNTANTKYFSNITNMNTFQLPTPSANDPHYYDIYLSSSLLGNSSNNFGFINPYPSINMQDIKVLEANSKVYMYGTIKINDTSYNNIIAYDLSGSIINNFNFNYSLVNSITQVNALVYNRGVLLVGLTGIVTVSETEVYTGIIVINQGNGYIVSSPVLKSINITTNNGPPQKPAVKYILPDLSNNLFLITDTDQFFDISGNYSMIAYFNRDAPATVNVLKNTTNNEGFFNINSAYYYSGYLYLTTNSNITAYTLNPDNTLTPRGSLRGSFFQPTNNYMASVNGKLYLLVQSYYPNPTNIYQFTNYDLTSYNVTYTNNSFKNLPSKNILSIYGSDSNLFVVTNNMLSCYNVDVSDNNVSINGYNPSLTTLFSSNFKMYFGSSNIYYTSPGVNSVVAYRPGYSCNFVVTSPANIDKVYIKNITGTLKLYESFNSLYYNGSTWVITTTTNNFVN
jgi:hypothetical protein